MPEYNAGIVIEGWAKIRVTADNREEVRTRLASCSVELRLLDANHEPIGEIVEPQPQFLMQEEEIEVHRPDEEPAYYAPARPAAAEVDLR